VSRTVGWEESATLEVDIAKDYGSFQLRVALSAGRDVLVLFGPSGSGKSVTLRSIAGLIRPDSGRIVIDGRSVFDAAAGIDLPPLRRAAGMVVQSYALFPHMSVADNIAFGLSGRPRRAREARVRELLSLLDIEDLHDRRPAQISGGQAQRVALARALAPEPRLLLLDEPFSALDTGIRVNLRRELARLQRELGLTVLFVTHDLREAYNLADRIAVFERGRVLQIGSRDEVFNHPASAAVARITDVRNIWRGRVVSRDAGETVIETERFLVRARPSAFRVGDAVDLCIRPERVVLVRDYRIPGDAARDSLLTADLVERVPHGASYTLYFHVRGGGPDGDGQPIEVDVSTHVYEALDVRQQSTWTLALPREAVHLMRPQVN
jgi:molybdate transport system ATP-binding protein